MRRTTDSARTPSFHVYGGNAAENYERYFVPAIGAPLAENLVRQAGLRQGERVLDVACGTGVVARLAAPLVRPSGSVIGVDLNPGMVAVAQSVEPDSIDWREGPADSLPIDDDSVDVAFCQMGLQFFADKTAALTEACRTLRPGGRLLLNVPGPTPDLFVAMEEALAANVSAEVSRFVGVVFSLHDAAVVADMLVQAGFDDVHSDARTERLTLPDPASFFWQYVHSTPLSAAVAGLDDAAKADLEDDVVRRWANYRDGGGLVLELGVTTGRGVRAK